MKKIIALVSLVVLIGCTIPVVIENPPGSGNLSTNHVTDPRFTKTVETIGAVNDATAGINPWHGLIAIILGAVSSGAAAWAKIRNTQKQLTTVVAGVEAKGGSDVKEAIQNIAMAKGIEDQLNKTVKKVTGG